MGAIRTYIIGEKVGHWTILGRDKSRQRVYWRCQCECGLIRAMAAQHLKEGKRLNCGCLLRTELLGRTFGRLRVKRYLGLKHGLRMWACECACGQEFIAKGNELKRGRTSSCGCWWREQLRAKSIKHGLSGSPEYLAWTGAKARCANQSDPNYGGRGIRMFQEWSDDFMVFYAAVGPRPTPEHSLDRINVNGNYEPGNVRWATRSEQQRNRRPFAAWRQITKAS